VTSASIPHGQLRDAPVILAATSRLAELIAMAANATAVMMALTTANDGGRRWRGTVLITASAIAFSLAGLFTRLIDLDVWTVLFWRALFGGIFIAGYIIWREAVALSRRFARPGSPGLR